MEKEDKELSRIVNMIVRTVFPQKIFLLGSRAMDTADKRSDYDIFVIVENGKNTRKMEKELYYINGKRGHWPSG